MQSTLVKPVNDARPDVDPKQPYKPGEPPVDDMNAVLDAMQDEAAATYRELVLATVAGHRLDVGVREIITTAGKSIAAFKADVERVQERQRLADELEAASEAGDRRQRLEATKSDLEGELACERQEFAVRMAPLQTSITKLESQIQAERAAQRATVTAMQGLQRTAAPSIEAAIQELRNRVGELTRQEQHLRTHGVRRPIDDARIKEFTHVKPGDSEVDVEATKAARAEVRAELADLNAQIEEINRRKLDWRNAAL